MKKKEEGGHERLGIRGEDGVMRSRDRRDVAMSQGVWPAASC
jgi:hypothetical protein